MADSLFDQRYRYDYIYPRGRSGETLRAVDTLEGERPVVIKRPAPNDAPPIRAGQEVSILNERKALQRLAGQPALTALLGSGQFVVGGTTHQYIVVERAEGEIVADLVLALARSGETLPELELLVILDRLLELLSAAHQSDIVYNDVDAKHLFWNRETYTLKIIDWGNAVFLEGDDATPQGVSRQSDVYQVGELLYFILSGGGRPDIPRDATDDFRVAINRDLHTRLHGILSRSLHPNLRVRYRSIDDLRKELADYRAPLERERASILARVVERLRRDRSRDELHSLLKALEPALAMDPGFPEARALQRDILDRLSDLEVQADLDGARIYLQNANWARAAALLDEVRPRARGTTLALVGLLIDWAKLLHDSELYPAPDAVLDGIEYLFEGDLRGAAARLLSDPPADSERILWLLAERISAHVPDVLLVRPNLYRLDAALAALSGEGIPVDEPRALIREIEALIDTAPASLDAVNLITFRDAYRAAVDQITALNTLLEAVNATYRLPNRRLPLSALDRALNATMALADHMHVIGRQATASPGDALAALDTARTIDPGSSAWTLIAELLNHLYERLQAYQTYVPAADGSDLDTWLPAAAEALQPFADRLFDEVLVGMIKGLHSAQRAWASYAAATVQGDRVGAITALATATDAVGMVSPTLAGWFNQLRAVITSAGYVERHALFGGLGRALADGWEAFDRGRLQDAERLGNQAIEIARTDPERYAARRLRDLAEAARAWVERGGALDPARTQTTLASVELLFTTDENTTRASFANQMPSKETYLKVMGKGLVDAYTRHSTAAVRILLVQYVLLGALDAGDGRLDDAAFWRDAAHKTLPDAARHPTVAALEDFIARRRDLLAAADLLNRVNGRAAMTALSETRKALEDNPHGRLIAAASYGLREIEAALRDWSDGEFRAAGIKIENALKAIDEAETQGAITLTGYRAWLMELVAGAAELHAISRQMQTILESKPDEPNDSVRAAHHRMVEVTQRLLGEAYVATLRAWRDTYEQFLGIYTDRSARRSARLARFNEQFRAMFIDRHPAYPLYRHWYAVTEQAPEFPAPPTDEPTPRMDENADPDADAARPSRYSDEGRERERRQTERRLPVPALIAAGVVVLVVAALALAQLANPPAPATVANTTGEADATDDAPAAASADAEETADTAASTQPAVTATSASGFTFFSPVPPEDFTTPSIVPSPLPLGALTQTVISRAVPTTPAPTLTPSSSPSATSTDAPSATSTVTATPTLTATPTPTLPPEGLRGEHDALALAAAQTNPDWTPDLFAPAPNASDWRLGAGTETGGELILVSLPAAALEAAYGSSAATRLVSTEATLTLTTYQPTLLAAEQVYFGALLVNAADPPLAADAQTIGVHALLAQPGVVSLGTRQGGDVQLISQRSVSAVVLRVRIERDPVTGIVSLFVNNDALGQPILFAGPDDPLVPALYVRGGGVIVTVNEWTVTLR